MRVILFILLCCSSNIWAQCSFETVWNYYPLAGSYQKVLCLKDGGFIVYGDGLLDTGFSDTKLLMFKVEACGNKVWTNDAGYEGDGPDMHAIEMENGNYMVVGTRAGGDIRMGKYNANGILIGEKFLTSSFISTAPTVFKNALRTNSYLITANNYNASTGRSRPLLVEVDEDLTVVRKKEPSHPRISASYWSYSGIQNIIQRDDTTLLVFIGAGNSQTDTSYITELDTSFNVKSIKTFATTDSTKDVGFFKAFLSEDKKYLTGPGLITFSGDSWGTDCLIKTDLDGNLIKFKKLNMYSSPTYASRTNDGGYLIGPQLLKVDSNFEVQWYKESRAFFLYSGFQLPNGGYIAAGVSDSLSGHLYIQPYLVRTDSLGNFFYSGLEDKLTKPVISIYPNPSTTGVFNLAGYETKGATLQVFNQQGQLLLNQPFTNNQFNLQSHPEGMYFVRLTDANGKLVHSQSVLKPK